MCPRDSHLVRGQYALERQRSPLAGLSGNVNRFTGVEAFACHFLPRTDEPGGRCQGEGLRLALHLWAGLQVTEDLAQHLPAAWSEPRSSPRPVLPIFRETFAEYLFIRVRMLSDKHMGEEVGERAVILSKNRWWLCLSCLMQAHHSPGVKLRSADFSCENLPTWSVYGMKEVLGVGEKGTGSSLTGSQRARQCHGQCRAQHWSQGTSCPTCQPSNLEPPSPVSKHR